MLYPEKSAVAEAGLQELLAWNRFLPSPASELELDILNDICDLLKLAREADPGSYVQASKNIGW